VSPELDRAADAVPRRVRSAPSASGINDLAPQPPGPNPSRLAAVFHAMLRKTLQDY
jgi:hypothetical protein